jgi:ribonuclease R
VQAHRNGDGWLLPDDGSAQIYLPRSRCAKSCTATASRRASRRRVSRPRQGTIVEVLERRTREVVGRLHVEAASPT